jgi:hypothetical protein
VEQAASTRLSIRDLPFYGIWKDRADIGDSIDYVNKLRDDPRGWRARIDTPKRVA